MAKAAIAARTSGDVDAMRRPILAGEAYSGAAARVEVLPTAERISLRAPAGSTAALSKALGLKLPVAPKASSSKGARMALWLGPDEWLVIDEAGADLLSACAGVKQLHSAVGVSHRHMAFGVSGPACEATLSAGCPQDLSLSVFPVGACTRTVLGKIEVVLMRTAKDSFRVECWRSYSDYCFTFLKEAARDAAL
ncbi:MAG: sarcosine oxidase subunit gamma [Rhizobiaceae bacterium]|nr:sarcosine oxidase subunit gamma [Rhizobiaceae bacterium]